MKSFSFAKALTVGLLVCCALPVACGDDDDAPTPAVGGDGSGGEPVNTNGGMSEGGAGGAAPVMLPPGLSDMPSTKACGADMCESVGVGPVFIDPCCANDSCGLDTGFLALVGASFKDKCQPKGQVGELDAGCPTTAPSTIPFESGGKTIMVPIQGFAGCCRDNGMCGVVVDEVVSPVLGKLATLGLGCVDAAPFFPSETPAACGSGGASMGGAGGMGGAAVGGDAPGGAGGIGGAGGNQ